MPFFSIGRGKPAMLIVVSTALGALPAAPARAQRLSAPAAAVAVPPVVTRATPVASWLSLGMPLAPAHLAQARGTGARVDTTLGGTVSSNSASQVSTGANIIQDGAFAGASGVPVVIQNTGANVLIQNATVIHLRLQ